MQAIKLPTLLEGESLAIWLELSDDLRNSIVDGIMPMAFISLEEFHQHQLHPGEAV